MWWVVVATLVGAAVAFGVASLRRETASTATLDARAGQYLTAAFALAAVAAVIFLSKVG